MSKKLHSKLLSVILCIAICCATLCSSIIAVNAAAADFNGTYTITVGDEKNAVPYAATEVKAQVKFDLPAGFVGGQFTAVADSTYTIGDTATAVAVTTKDGSEVDLADITVKKANGSDKFRFVIGNGTLCTSVTIEYTLLISTYVNNGTTKQYPVSITLDEDDLIQFATYDLQDVTFTASAESDTWFHSHSSWYGTNGLVLDAEKNGKHTVTTDARCHWCTTPVQSGGLGLDINDNYIPQVIPDYTEFDGATTPVVADGDTDGDAHTSWIGISGVTVRYNDDGGLDVDVHVYSQYRTSSNGSDKIILFVCDEEGNELYRMSPVANGSSYYAGNGFPTTEKLFTITGLSARDIEKNLLLTAIEYSTGTIEHSRTMTFNLADYCQNVVEENSTIWASGATDAQIEADKDVAAALYYYGAAIDESVFDKNTSASSNIDYVNANYDEWDGTKVQPTETDTDGNIVIRNAEQLAWVALEGAANTANKNYKVVENSVFNMKGMDGITLSSTAAQVKAAGNARVAENLYSADQNWRSAGDNNSYAFQGNFDGNGLIAYNVYSYVYANAGLFPCVDPSTQGTITIKNVSVVASYIGAYHYAGGIIGLANASAGTGKNMVIENCATKTSYINDMGKGSGHNRTVATIVGSLSHNGTTINNCLALNNELSATGIVGGSFGNTSNFGSAVTVSNSITIGTAIAPTSVEVAFGSKVANTTYTNVYDEDVAAATLGSAWFDTATYPELSMFHKLAKVYADESTHNVICVLKAGDNTCSLKGLTEEHTLVKNADGTAKVCECGYSVPIYKDIEYITANYDEWDGTKVQPTETDADGNVIINNAEELAWVTLSGGASTANVNYKVKANSVFNMMGMSGITLDSTAEQVKAATKNSTYLWSNASNYFMGNFDGNGLTVYNINAAVAGSYGYNGLFPVIQPENDTQAITIKNVTVAASHFEGYHNTGGIVGFAQNQSSNSGCINIDSCATKNCYFYDTVRKHNSTSGLIIGQVNHNSGNVSNCLAIGNLSDMAKINGGIVGTSSNYISTQTVSNCVVIGSLPYSTVVEGSGATVGTRIENATVTNVYTDQTSTKTGYTTLATEQLTGTGAVANMGLSSVWFDTATYPELSIFHSMTDEFVDEATHKSVCIIVANGANCTVCGPAVEHALVKNDETNKMECDCGYYEDIIGNTVTPNHTNYDEWDGTKVQPTETDADGNVIINNAEELAWVTLSGGASTANVNYKVKANSVFNMMGMSGITLDSTAEQVKAATKNSTYLWSNASNYFMGNFDGNGLTVYNINAAVAGSYGYNGLFPVIQPENDAQAITIKNVTVAASHFEGYHNTGGIVGFAQNQSSNSGCINIDSCATKNCYFYDTVRKHNSTSGLIIGQVNHNSGNVSNCLAIGNLSDMAKINGGIVGTSSNYISTQTVSNCVVIGSLPYSTVVEGSGATVGTRIESATVTNVYTDQTSTKTGYTTLATEQLTGTGAVANTGLGSVWFDTATYPELSIFHDMYTIYVDETTHQSVCQHFINGTQCTTTGVAVSHTMVDSEDGKSASCECGYSYEIKGIHAMNLPDSVYNRITSNSVYAEKFATNALFKAGYNEDVPGTHTIDNEFDLYGTSLNLKVNPHIGFTFAFHGDYKTNRSGITVTLTVDGEDYTTEAVETDGTLGTNWVNNKNAGRYHLYRFKQLPVSKLCKDVKVAVNYDGTTYDFGTYSAAGYAINAMNAGEDYMYHVNASMALVYYSEMLAARAGL